MNSENRREKIRSQRDMSLQTDDSISQKAVSTRTLPTMTLMHIDDEYQYAVVQFLELPHLNIDDYVCVPHSWIRMRRGKDRRTTVAVPDEPWMLTKIRIKKGEKPLESWNAYMAIIKYETYSYIDANLYIMGKKTVASTRNKHSDPTSLPDSATGNISFSFKRIKLSEPQSKTNEKKMEIIDKAKFIDQFPKMNQSPGYANLESETPPSHILKKMNETRISSFRTGTQGPKRNILYAPRNLLILKNEILRNYPELDDDLSSLFCDRSQNEGSVEEKQKRNILNQEACVPEISIPQHQVQNFEASSSFIIQNQINLSNQSHQTRKSLVSQDHPQALPAQTTPGRTSEMELTYQIPSCSNPAEHQDSSTQAMIVDEPTEASCNEQTVQSERSTENESFASINSRENVGQSCQSVVMEEEKTTTDQVSSTEETDTEDLLTDGNFVEEADQQADSITDIRDRWKCQLADIFAEMDSDFSHACEVTSELHQSFVRSASAIKRMKNIYESFRNERVKEASVVTPKDVTVDDKEATVEDKDERNQAEKKKEERPDEDMNEDEEKSRDEKAKNSEDDNDDNGDNSKDNNGDDESSENIEDDEEKEAPMKTRGHIRTFVLPAEYDPNDTRWTLKYRESNPKLGLVELLPRTKVYINSIRLSHCKRVAKDSKTLARMLLVEIFTQTALSVCSLTGARANAFNISGTKVRPGLDEHARMVILNFVEEHARRKNWGVFDTQSVINSIRSKIQEMRAKYGQTE